jgi:hypothetical protein
MVIKLVNGVNMYSLNCTYYTKEFKSINELIDDVIINGMDPSYEITFNNKETGEFISELIIE